MNNGEYWQKRFELLEQAAHQQGVQCYADIEKQYRQAQKQLEGQIAAWYQRFASNNGVTLADAKRMLTAKTSAFRDRKNQNRTDRLSPRTRA